MDELWNLNKVPDDDRLIVLLYRKIYENASELLVGFGCFDKDRWLIAGKLDDATLYKMVGWVDLPEFLTNRKMNES